MGKQGGSVEQEEPQVSPDLNVSRLTCVIVIKVINVTCVIVKTFPANHSLFGQLRFGPKDVFRVQNFLELVYKNMHLHQTEASNTMRIRGKRSHRFQGVVDVMVQPLAPLHHLQPMCLLWSWYQWYDQLRVCYDHGTNVMLVSDQIRVCYDQFWNHVGEPWIWWHCDARQKRTRHKARIRFPVISPL